MSKTKEAVKEEVKEMTPEEIAAQRAELLKHYEDEIPLLEKRAEYEELITRIEIAKMQRFEMMVAKAQMMAPPPGEDEAGPQRDPATKERKLQKES